MPSPTCSSTHASSLMTGRVPPDHLDQRHRGTPPVTPQIASRVWEISLAEDGTGPAGRLLESTVHGGPHPQLCLETSSARSPKESSRPRKRGDNVPRARPMLARPAKALTLLGTSGRPGRRAGSPVHPLPVANLAETMSTGARPCCPRFLRPSSSPPISPTRGCTRGPSLPHQRLSQGRQHAINVLSRPIQQKRALRADPLRGYPGSYRACDALGASRPYSLLVGDLLALFCHTLLIEEFSQTEGHRTVVDLLIQSRQDSRRGSFPAGAEGREGAPVKRGAGFGVRRRCCRGASRTAR